MPIRQGSVEEEINRSSLGQSCQNPCHTLGLKPKHEDAKRDISSKSSQEAVHSLPGQFGKARNPRSLKVQPLRATPHAISPDNECSKIVTPRKPGKRCIVLHEHSLISITLCRYSDPIKHRTTQAVDEASASPQTFGISWDFHGHEMNPCPPPELTVVPPFSDNNAAEVGARFALLPFGVSCVRAGVSSVLLYYEVSNVLLE
ncbi:hypothetical protein B296_00057982 [Ensete ventricosum]|uniref:Uncharacterized protein n=1 Tax=Ensete ventricosum TaxID=4639 RepID=A0A426WWZ8_ENSVE|nr:hypothetical protein B296_00057982 [Ensete ventricosum]